MGTGYRMDHGSVFNRLYSSCDDLQVGYHARIASRGNLNEVLRYSAATTNYQTFRKIVIHETSDIIRDSKLIPKIATSGMKLGAFKNGNITMPVYHRA